MSNRIVEIAEESKEFVMLEDGFVYYWPNKSGAISAHELRALADEIDRRNRDWHDQINEYFEN